MNDESWELLELYDQRDDMAKILKRWHERFRRMVVPERFREDLRQAASELHYADVHDDVLSLQLALSFCESVVQEIEKWMKER